MAAGRNFPARLSRLKTRLAAKIGCGTSKLTRVSGSNRYVVALASFVFHVFIGVHRRSSAADIWFCFSRWAKETAYMAADERR